VANKEVIKNPIKSNAVLIITLTRNRIYEPTGRPSTRTKPSSSIEVITVVVS